VFELKKEALESHEALITLEVHDEALQKAMRKAARQISRQTNIPGFRKGKAPYSIVMQTFGENAVRQEAADLILEEIYPQAIEQAKIDPYGPGQLDDMSLSPMVFKIRIPLQPIVDLGDYESLRKEPETVEVTEEEFNAALENIREQNAILEAVERGAETGDQVSFESINGEVNGQVIFHDHDTKLILGDNETTVLPGFDEAVAGAVKGETKTFTLTLPEDFDEEDLQGEEAEFTVKVDEVYNRTLPELNDALASTVGPFETLDEMKEKLQGQMLEYKEANARDAYRSAIIEDLTERAEVKYPPVMEEEELDSMIAQLKENIEHRYSLSWEDFLRLQGQTEAQVREDMKPDAVQKIKQGLVLNEFSKISNVEVTDSELKDEFHNLLQSVNVTDEETLNNFDPASKIAHELRLNVLGRKTIERLERLAQGLPLEEESEPEADSASEDKPAEDNNEEAETE